MNSILSTQDEEYLISNSKEDPTDWFLESKYTKLKTELRSMSQVLIFVSYLLPEWVNFDRSNCQLGVKNIIKNGFIHIEKKEYLK